MPAYWRLRKKQRRIRWKSTRRDLLKRTNQEVMKKQSKRNKSVKNEPQSEQQSTKNPRLRSNNSELTVKRKLKSRMNSTTKRQMKPKHLRYNSKKKRTRTSKKRSRKELKKRKRRINTQVPQTMKYNLVTPKYNNLKMRKNSNDK